jgi:general secretion pathway protein A
VFLAPYKLATNPFDAAQARPLFESVSVLELVESLNRLAKAETQCLLVSGEAGVGKTRVVRRWLQERDADFSVSWVQVGADNTREQFFNSLLADLGLAAVDGSVGELRNILEVFLKHQAGQGRRSIIVADDLDRIPAAHLGEFEWLADLRWRGLPVVNLVLIARDDELVRSLIPGGGKGNYVHQQLRAFSLEETWNYLVWCLQNAGCDPIHQLISEELIPQLHGFSGGVAANINVLCGTLLNEVAKQASRSKKEPTVTDQMVRRVAKKLGMKFDPEALNKVEEPLSADSVHQSDPGTLNLVSARVLVASGGKIIAEIELERPRMVLGRDRACDISLDSRYVSRFQNLFLETEGGWWLLDLNSTNGSYINGRRIKEHRLQDGDVIAVGRHQLRFFGPGEGQVAGSDAATLIQPTRARAETATTAKPQTAASSSQTA